MIMQTKRISALLALFLVPCLVQCQELARKRNLVAHPVEDQDQQGSLPTRPVDNHNYDNLAVDVYPVLSKGEESSLRLLQTSFSYSYSYSYEPTSSPSAEPSKPPTKQPTKSPTKQPSAPKSPTKEPTKEPTQSPNSSPTKAPTKSPVTSTPTKGPTKAPTNSPTESPTKAPVPLKGYCGNDPIWHWYDSPKVTCKFIRFKEHRRQKFCPKAYVQQACKQACGICCEDDPNYDFIHDENHGDCDWVSTSEERKETYCKLYLNGRRVNDACPVACNLCLSQATSAPTPSSPATSSPTPALCLNDHLWNFMDFKDITCLWIRGDLSRRQRYCPKVVVSQKCPQSCGHCCMNEPYYSFYIDGATRKCDWVGESSSRKDMYCGMFLNRRLVEDACPLACDVCVSPL